MSANPRKSAGRAREKLSASRPSPDAGPKTRRGKLASKEAAMIYAARELFREQGFAGTTMAQIARAAGVADGTLYLYFDNKEAMARAVLAAFYEELTQSARRGVAKAGTTKERLRFLARHHLDHIIAERRLLALLVILDQTADESPSSYSETQFFRMNKTYVAVFDEVVREAVWRGEISKATPLWVMRDLFYGSLDYAMRSIMLPGRDRKRQVAVEGVVAALCKDASGREGGGEAARLTSVTDRLERLADRMESGQD